MPLSTEQQNLLHASFQELSASSDVFIETFYNTLWELAPETKPLFEKTNMVQQGKKLMMILAHVFGALGNDAEMQEVMHEVGSRHVNYGVSKDMFYVMQTVLLETLAKVLGKSFTNEVKDAWLAVFRVMVNSAVSAY